MRPFRSARGPAARSFAHAKPLGAACLLLACASPREEAARADTGAAARVSAGATGRAAPESAGPARVTENTLARPDTPARPAPPASAAPSAAASADTLTGVVDVVGSALVSRVVVRTPGGGEVVVTGDAAPLLRPLAGLEVTARGARDARAFRASSFVVRSADGRPALDGRLSRAADRWTITTADGVPHPLADPPASLRQHQGKRVWAVLEADRRVARYGVIE